MMKEKIDAVINASARLQEIRTRLAAIEEERAALEAEAKDILHRAGMGAVAATTGEWRDGRLPITRRVLSFLAARPAERFAVAAIGHALGFSHKKQMQTLRGTLARLSDEGRVVRNGLGLYSGKPGAV